MSTTITIKTVKRASGYQAWYELPGSCPVRCVGYATRQDAIKHAQQCIRRTMDTRVPGMSSVTIKAVCG